MVFSFTTILAYFLSTITCSFSFYCIKLFKNLYFLSIKLERISKIIFYVTILIIYRVGLYKLVKILNKPIYSINSSLKLNNAILTP